MAGRFGGLLRVQVALGCALTLMGASVIGGGRGAGQRQGGYGAGCLSDPLQLFQPMMPVLHHERCANCHGGVDVFSDQSHGGGALAKSEVPLDTPKATCSQARTATPPVPNRRATTKRIEQRLATRAEADVVRRQGCARAVQTDAPGERPRDR